MANFLPVLIDPSESTLNMLARRTKFYFLNEIMAKLVDRYILMVHKLAKLLNYNFDCYLTLEDDVDHNDLIEGVQQIYY